MLEVMCLDLSLAFFTLTFSEWFVFESLFFLRPVAFNNSAVNHRVHAYTILPTTSYCFNTILISLLSFIQCIFIILSPSLQLLQDLLSLPNLPNSVFYLSLLQFLLNAWNPVCGSQILLVVGSTLKYSVSQN